MLLFLSNPVKMLQQAIVIKQYRMTGMLAPDKWVVTQQRGINTY